MADSRKRRRLSLSGSFETNGAAAEDADTLPNVPQTTSSPLKRRRSLFVRSLPATVTTEGLTEHFSQSYPLKHATVVLDPETKQSKGYGFVTFADPDDAQRAADEFNGSVFGGRKIKVEVAEPRHREIDESVGKSAPSATATKLKAERESRRTQAQPPKLIIRNLPWSLKEPEQLALLFRSYGKVKHAIIPKKKPGLLAGFGFVVMRGRKNAEKAIEGVNGKEVDGRPLAVDWAVEKSVWEGTQKDGDRGGEVGDGPIDVEQAQDSGDAHLGKSEDGVVEEDADEISRSAVSLVDDDEDENDSVENDSEADSDEEVEVEGERVKNIEENSTTIFVRNLPFTSTDEILRDHFSQFGPLRYARVVLDPETDRSKGTGFVCFYDPTDALSCLREAPKQRDTGTVTGTKNSGNAASTLKHSVLENKAIDISGRYTMDDRVLQVSRAVSKTEAVRLEAAGSSVRISRDRDRRRLSLLSEGTIPKGSPLYAKLSPTEINIREASLKQRQAIVKNNPSLHLSLTRLSIRNIPRNISSKDLKALARKAVVGFAKDVKSGARQPLSKEELYRSADAMKEAEKQRKLKGKGIVKQAKIVIEGREGGKVAEKSGGGRSRGYGFIEYVSHRSALMGLRWLNGHAVTAGENAKEGKKRLIVEFSIENAQVVGRRQDNEAKARNPTRAFEPKRSRDQQVNGKKEAARRVHKGLKRKRARDIEDSRSEEKSRAKVSGNTVPQTSDSVDKNKTAKRNRIIAKKRMTRRARKGPGGR